jgi:hypothetical protein
MFLEAPDLMFKQLGMMLFLRMERFTEANGSAHSSTAMEFKSGLMELATKEIGAKIKPVAKVNSGT